MENLLRAHVEKGAAAPEVFVGELFTLHSVLGHYVSPHMHFSNDDFHLHAILEEGDLCRSSWLDKLGDALEAAPTAVFDKSMTKKDKKEFKGQIEQKSALVKQIANEIKPEEGEGEIKSEEGGGEKFKKEYNKLMQEPYSRVKLIGDLEIDANRKSELLAKEKKKALEKKSPDKEHLLAYYEVSEKLFSINSRWKSGEIDDNDKDKMMLEEWTRFQGEPTSSWRKGKWLEINDQQYERLAAIAEETREIPDCKERQTLMQELIKAMHGAFSKREKLHQYGPGMSFVKSHLQKDSEIDRELQLPLYLKGWAETKASYEKALFVDKYRDSLLVDEGHRRNYESLLTTLVAHVNNLANLSHSIKCGAVNPLGEEFQSLSVEEIEARIERATQTSVPKKDLSKKQILSFDFFREMKHVDDVWDTLKKGIVAILFHSLTDKNKLPADGKSQGALLRMAKEMDETRDAYKALRLHLMNRISEGFPDDAEKESIQAEKILSDLEYREYMAETIAFSAKSFALMQQDLESSVEPQEDPEPDVTLEWISKTARHAEEQGAVVEKEVQPGELDALLGSLGGKQSRDDEEKEAPANVSANVSTSKEEWHRELRSNVIELMADAAAKVNSAQDGVRQYQKALSYRQESDTLKEKVIPGYEQAAQLLDKAMAAMEKAKCESLGFDKHVELSRKQLEHLRISYRQNATLYRKYQASPTSRPLEKLDDEELAQLIESGAVEVRLPTDMPVLRTVGKDQVPQLEYVQHPNPVTLEGTSLKISGKPVYGHVKLDAAKISPDLIKRLLNKKNVSAADIACLLNAIDESCITGTPHRKSKLERMFSNKDYKKRFGKEVFVHYTPDRPENALKHLRMACEKKMKDEDVAMSALRSRR